MSEKQNSSENKGFGLLMKVIIIVVFTSTIFLSGFGWYRYQHTSKDMIRQINDVLELSTERMSISLKSPLNDYDDNGIKATVSAEMKSHLIVGVFIMDEDIIQYGFSRNEAGELVKADTLLSEQGCLISNQKITMEDTELGQLKVYVTRRYLEEELQQLLTNTFVEVIILDIMLMLVLTFFIRFVVVSPLNRLALFITKVSCGDFSDSSDTENLNSDLKRGDEMGKMTKSVVEMRNSIQKLMKETDSLIKGVQDGRLDIRGNTDEFKGGWQELVTGMNRVLDAFTDPISVTAECLDSLAKGDIPGKITKEYLGDFNKIIDNLNRLISTTDEITQIAEAIGGGNMMVDASERSDNDRLMKALNSMIKGLQGTVNIAEKIAEGDLTVQVNILSENDLLGKSLNKMLRDLTRFAVSVQNTSGNVAAGSEQISSSATQISQGISQQAAGIEEISASMEEMSSTISQNADNARQTAGIASKTAEDAKEGRKALNQTVKAMESITEKIMIIDEIARQTAMLSLNASIEAARAQEHGKGFAVVAKEVGKLSKRTQKAAKAVNELSISNITIAGNAGDLIEKMVSGIEKTADLVQEISASCSEQSNGIEQVNNAVQQLDQVVQQNAGSTEEMASSSQDFTSQAESLLESVSFFNLPEDIAEDEDTVRKSVEKIEQFFQDRTDQDISAFAGLFEKLQNRKNNTGNQAIPCSTGISENNSCKNSVIKKSPVARVNHSKKHGSLTNFSAEMMKAGKIIDIKETNDKDFEKY